jgi:hypothetical protein
MRWDAVIQAVAARAAGDPILASIYGTTIRKMGVHTFAVPSLEYMLVSRGVTELWEPHIIQFSQWAHSLSDVATSDRRLGQLFDHENMQVIEGVTMWSSFEDGGDLVGPAREGVYGTAARYRFTPVRERLLSGRGG